MYQYGQMYLISSIQTTNNTKHPTYYNQHHDSPTQCSQTIVVSRLPYRVSTPQSRAGQMHDHAIWWGPSWSGYNRKQPEHWTNNKPNFNPNHHPNKYQADQSQNYLTSTWNTNRTNIKPIRTDPYIFLNKMKWLLHQSTTKPRQTTVTNEKRLKTHLDEQILKHQLLHSEPRRRWATLLLAWIAHDTACLI